MLTFGPAMESVWALTSGARLQREAATHYSLRFPETNGRFRVLISPVISRADRFRVM